MSDRGLLFLFSLLVDLAALGAAGCLLITGQATSVDGLFLFLTCLVLALAFGLYLAFLVHRAVAAATGAEVKAAKAPSTTPQPRAKAEPVTQA